MKIDASISSGSSTITLRLNRMDHARDRNLRVWYRLTLFLVLTFFAVAGSADTILGTKHDLSVSGPGPIKAVSESEVCLFCHAPHNGTGETPLWNHDMS